jgi:glycosyltransferase involved in cell wall biosynthesis
MFSSTIIPTINRSSLSRAVWSVLSQDFEAADFEVIVVNDSGGPLPDTEWRRSGRVRVLNTDRRERSVARNTGAAIATGGYLHFLDDDDVLLPNALRALWTLSRRHSDCAWLYGDYTTVDNDGNVVEEIRPAMRGNIFAHLVSGEDIPLQESLLRRTDFGAAGAFDPLSVGVEDRDLGRRIALRGSVAYTANGIAQIRIGEQGSTTTWKTLAEKDRWGREQALGIPGAFGRLRSSAVSSYWHGRVTRAYFASAVWNLKRGRILTTTSRASAGLAFAGPHMLSPEFWNGLRTGVR